MRNDQGFVSRLRVRCYRFRMMGSASFSERHGYHGADVEITTRGDAPEEVRAAVLMHGCAAGIGPGGMRGMAARRCASDPIPIIVRRAITTSGSIGRSTDAMGNRYTAYESITPPTKT